MQHASAIAEAKSRNTAVLKISLNEKVQAANHKPTTISLDQTNRYTSQPSDLT
tara:strand:- start:1082 stop:1240 length:159 start_codon:yes stop_codon:yes gene_type:complete